MLKQETSRANTNSEAVVSFSELFERYSSNTDGKEKIADYVNSLGVHRPNAILLDLGAGDGRLTRKLLQGFSSIIAVEKEPDFHPNLRSLPGVSVVASSIEKFTPPQPYDVGLFSYSLSGIPKDHFGSTIKNLLSHRSKEGSLLFVTYLDGCPWDRYADSLASHFQTVRTGGLRRHQEELHAAGFNSKVVTTLATSVWGESTESLFKNLGFFCYRNITGYMRDKEHFMPILKGLQVESGGRVHLPVTEVVVEIAPGT